MAMAPVTTKCQHFFKALTQVGFENFNVWTTILVLLMLTIHGAYSWLLVWLTIRICPSCFPSADAEPLPLLTPLYQVTRRQSLPAKQMHPFQIIFIQRQDKPLAFFR